MKRVEITWDDEAQTILCCKFSPGWTLDDFYEAYSQSENMIRQSPNHVVGIIVDDSQNTSPPQGAISAFKHIFKRGNLPMAIIGGHQLTQLLLKAIRQMAISNRFIVQVADYDEARSTLTQNAATSTDS